MKKIIYFFLFFLVSLAANSQVQRPSGNASPNSPSSFYLMGYAKADSGFLWKQRDTFPAKYPTIIWHTNGNFYKSLGNGAAWSLFAATTAGTVSSVSGNAPISVVNGTTTPTISADTSYNGLATKKWLYKVSDSLGYVKLNLSDTLSMLLPYLRKSDTVSMLSGYLRKGDTTNMLSGYVRNNRTITTNAPLFGGGDLSANRTLSADTGRAVSQLVTGGSLTAVKDTLVTLIASSGGGTVLDVSTTDGIGIVSSVATPTSTPNISIRVDTVAISTRDWRQKGIDSVQNNLTNGLALKLNLSDTAAMLSNRFKISDTLTMLLPYLRKSDTSFMLSPYRRTTTKIQNSDLANSTISGVSLGSNLNSLNFGTYLQGGASSYNGATAVTISTNATSTNTASTLVARDVNGDFSARNISASLLGNASSASTIAITNDISTNDTYYPMFSTVTTGSTSTKVASSKLTFNPSTGALSSTSFIGNLTGNASSATVLQTPRTINGVAFDGSANITISASVSNSITNGYGISGSPYDGSLARTWDIDTNLIVPYTDTNFVYGIATKSFVRSLGYGTGSVTSVATNTGSGITGGTITTTGTIAADTSILSTKANVVGLLVGYTTTAANALKLNISDTAAMLANRLKISDTATMLSGYKTYYPRTAISAGSGISYNAATGVITNSSPSSGGTVTSIATSAPITGGTITSTGTIGITQSTTSTDGYLSSTDWNTFNNKASTASVALKLNISDTASMLSNYRRATTLIENADLRNSAITINGTSTSLGGSINVGTVTSVAASAGTGISVSGSPITSSGTLTITNTAPDQTVTLTAGTGISVSGTYPSFTVTNTSPSSGGTVTSVSAGTGMSFTTITSTGAVNADTTVLATRAYAAGLDVAKANTSLNNVNGVLSSTYGGAGSVNGILKANGSGTVSAAVAGDIPNLSGSYVDLTSTQTVGGAKTFTSALSGTSASFSGNLDLGFNNNLRLGTSPFYYKITRSNVGQLFTYFDDEYDVSNTATLFRFRTSGTPVTTLRLNSDGSSVLGGALSGTSASFSGGVTAASLNTSTSSNVVGVINTTNATGGYLEWQTNGTTIADIGTATQVFGSGGSEVFAINGRGARAIAFGTNSSQRMQISIGGNLLIGTTTDNGVDKLQVAGSATFSSSVTASSFVKSGGTSSQFLKADGSVDGSTYLTSSGAVTSLTGTTNQVTVSASTGAVTVSLPSAVTISGAMTASSFFEASDLRKKDIISVTEQADGIDFIAFNWKKEFNLDNRKHLGVIAQQVEQVIPDAVTTDEKGFKSVNYTEVMLYKLEKLTEKVSELEKELKKLKTNSKKLKN